jgi:hypothetical protein
MPSATAAAKSCRGSVMPPVSRSDNARRRLRLIAGAHDGTGTRLVALGFKLEDEAHAPVVVHATAGHGDKADDGARVRIAERRLA